MKAQVALVVTVCLSLAGCRHDDLTPTSAAPRNAAAAEESFLAPVPDPALSNTQRDLLATIRGRSTTAEVYLARLAATPTRALATGSVVRLAVAPGMSVVATGERFAERGPGDVSWAGPLRGGGWVQMVLADGGVNATVQVGSTTYSIEPLGEGLHAVSRLDPTGFPASHPADSPSGALSGAITNATDAFRTSRDGKPGSSGGEAGALANTTINVMVVYTPSVAAATSNIGSLIQLAVDETNQGYANSGVSITMNRVYTGQVSYIEGTSSFSTHVSRLRGTTDGYMDNVHTLRNTYAADVVVLVVNDSEACGIAAAIQATATTAFTVNHYSCLTGTYDFAHEIGHLQGAKHEGGFVDPNHQWRTIMALGSACNGCPRINYWSTPLKTYNGVPLGTTTYKDNARVLNNTRATIASFR